MEQIPALGQSWAMLLDPVAAQSMIERMSRLNYRRRICRPLDRRAERIIDAKLAQYDAEVEAANDEIIGD